MSTDEQKLSLAYQATAIQRYAQKHGFAVVSTYKDRGRSGLTLKRRKGLTQLLQEYKFGVRVALYGDARTNFRMTFLRSKPLSRAHPLMPIL